MDNDEGRYQQTGANYNKVCTKNRRKICMFKMYTIPTLMHRAETNKHQEKYQYIDGSSDKILKNCQRKLKKV